MKVQLHLQHVLNVRVNGHIVKYLGLKKQIGGVNLTVRKMYGDPVQLDIVDTLHISDLKDMIAQNEQLEKPIVDRQRLTLLRGEQTIVLEDGQTISSYNIEPDKVINLILADLIPIEKDKELPAIIVLINASDQEGLKTLLNKYKGVIISFL